MALLTDFLPVSWLGRIAFSALLFSVYWVLWIIYCRTLHPLARVPGPLWPAVSRTWMMYHIYLGDIEIVERELHAKYGPLFRCAPNEVRSSDPAAIPTIYRLQDPLAKSDYYPTMRPMGISKQADLFTNTDEANHTKHRKIVNPAYMLSSILKSEDAIDDCTELFVKRLGEFADNKQPVDFGEWLEMYAYDVIGAVLFGRMLGFMEKSYDHGGWIAAVDNALPLLTFAAVGPSYMRPLIMMSCMVNPTTLKSFMAVNGLTTAAREQTQLRMKDSDEENQKRHDILSQLFRIIREKGDKLAIDFTHNEVTLEAWVGIIAGADSTASGHRAVFYYLMKNPRCLTKVHAEIDAADAAGNLSSPIKYSEATTHLKYTCLCIKEAHRLFAPFGVGMPRLAPPEGLELSGYHIPAGYRAGINAHTVNLDQEAFGADADQFRPERWMESDERSFAMEKALLTFGAGTRTCTGKNIVAAQVYKMVPEVLRHFDLKMAHDRPWKTQNAAFIKQRDVIVNFTRRTR